MIHILLTFDVSSKVFANCTLHSVTFGAYLAVLKRQNYEKEDGNSIQIDK